MKRLWIIGSGGHAKVVIDSALASGQYDVVGALDDDENRWGAENLGIPVIGEASPDAVRRFGIDLAIVAIGSNWVRAEMVRRLDGIVAWAAVIHPLAYVARGVEVGEGSVLCAGAIVQPDARIGRHAILNTGSGVDHESSVGDFAHLAPGSRLGGCVRIRSSALLGIGSCILPGLTVGAGATIGGGAVVTRDIPAGVTAIGVPAQAVSPRSKTCGGAARGLSPTPRPTGVSPVR